MKRHSLFFGVNDYAPGSGFYPLKCARRDAEELGRLFADPAFAGDSPAPMVRLDRTHAEAKEDVRQLLTRPDFRPKADLVHIHFSGHGARDDEGDFYLCFRDAEAGDLAFSALNYSELKRWLEVKQVARALVTLDCCHSGAAIFKDAGAGAAVLAKTIASDPGPDGAQGKGYCVITASGDSELAKEGSDLSLFTHHLIEGIETGAADRGEKGFITATDLHHYVARGVAEEAARMRPHIGGKTDGEIFVAFNPAVTARRAAETAAAAAAAFEARMAEFRRSVRDWLRTRLQDGTFEAAFVADVESWLQEMTPEKEASERFRLLSQALARDISATRLYQSWVAPEAPRSPAPEAPRSPAPDGRPTSAANAPRPTSEEPTPAAPSVTAPTEDAEAVHFFSGWRPGMPLPEAGSPGAPSRAGRWAPRGWVPAGWVPAGRPAPGAQVAPPPEAPRRSVMAALAAAGLTVLFAGVVQGGLTTVFFASAFEGLGTGDETSLALMLHIQTAVAAVASMWLMRLAALRVRPLRLETPLGPAPVRWALSILTAVVVFFAIGIGLDAAGLVSIRSPDGLLLAEITIYEYSSPSTRHFLAYLGVLTVIALVTQRIAWRYLKPRA